MNQIDINKGFHLSAQYFLRIADKLPRKYWRKRKREKNILRVAYTRSSFSPLSRSGEKIFRKNKAFYVEG